MQQEPSPTTPGWYQDDWGRRHWWDGTEWNDDAAPGRSKAIGDDVPGLVGGLVSSILGLLLVPSVAISVALGIVALFQSGRALRHLSPGQPGRRVAQTARVIAVVAIAISVIIAAYYLTRVISIT